MGFMSHKGKSVNVPQSIRQHFIFTCIGYFVALPKRRSLIFIIRAAFVLGNRCTYFNRAAIQLARSQPTNPSRH